MNKVIYYFVKCIGVIIFKLLYFPKIEGKENIPKTGGVVITCNHTSFLDGIFMVYACNRPIHMLAKKELFKKGILNFGFRSIGCIPVDRSIHDENAKSEVIDILNEGKVLGIFPEGTINRTLGTKDEVMFLPFKRGAFKFASKTDSYIVPAVVSGGYNMFKGTAKITYGKPYKVESDFDKENKKLVKTMEKMLKNEEKMQK